MSVYYILHIYLVTNTRVNIACFQFNVAKKDAKLMNSALEKDSKGKSKVLTGGIKRNAGRWRDSRTHNCRQPLLSAPSGLSATVEKQG